jgi:hypothetical protein
VNLARHPRPAQAAPIRIRADALAPNLPARDLWVSPQHGILFEGSLIQARALVNGATVVQEFPPQVTYVHVELDRHSLLLAEGLAAESYLDSGNRGLFAAEPGVRPLHPDFAGSAAPDHRSCAPLLLGRARLAAAHGEMLARAQALGWELSEDPALMLLAEGEPLAFRKKDLLVWAMLPAGTRTVQLASRSFVPAALAQADDHRKLGVAVASLRLSGTRLKRSAFGTGWHAPEPGWRWTDGDAALFVPQMPKPTVLSLTLAKAEARYWDMPRRAEMRQAKSSAAVLPFALRRR